MFVCATASSQTAVAQTSFPLTISDNTVRAAIELPGGYGVDLSITFEQVVGLNPSALVVSAALVSPLDLTLISRLPGGSLAAIPAAFPVLLQIEPTPLSGLTLSGVVTISLHTHNLNLDPDSALGLYAAPIGGPFRDITKTVGMGSYRVDGSTGGFSEFLIAADSRTIDTIITEKFTALNALLDEHATLIDDAIESVLRQQVGQAYTYYVAGTTRAAIGELTAFERTVNGQGGHAIPDVWSARGGVTNVAGLLRSAANTLKFSLTIKTTRSL